MRVGRQRVWRLVLGAAVIVVACLTTVSEAAQQYQAYAAGAYAAGEQGYDISWPQCGGAYPAATYAFGIVGATDGRAFTLNPCLASEYAWAQASANPTQTSLYMNLNYPSGSTASQGQTGPYGTCKNGSVCYAENYGWKAARYAFTQNDASAPVAASIWWLDIETDNSWSRYTALNAYVIQGAIAYLQAQGVMVGVYSTTTQWKTIAGSYAPAVPNWVAGASASNPDGLCATPLYQGGSVWLAQHVSGGFDVDYSC